MTVEVRQPQAMWEFPAGELAQLASLRAWAEAPSHRLTLARQRAGEWGKLEDRHRRVETVERLAGHPAATRFYGVTLTITEGHDGVLFRHASVSVDQATGEPMQAVVELLLKELGFRGNFASWYVRRKTTGPIYEILEPFIVN